jgi:hypothetical protein
MQPVGMNAALFWRLIEQTKEEAGGDQDIHEELLIEALSQLSDQDIGIFYAIYHFYHQLADRSKLITAAAIIDGFLTDDSFEYFRPWLIGEGERTYKSALANPDNLAEVANPDEFADFECLMAVPMWALLRKQGKGKDDDEAYEAYDDIWEQMEFYGLDEQQIAECQDGIVLDPDIDNAIFGWASNDRDQAHYQAMRQEAFPRLLAKCDEDSDDDSEQDEVLPVSGAVNHTDAAKQRDFSKDEITQGILACRLTYVKEEIWQFRPLTLWDGQLQMHIPTWFVPWTEQEQDFDQPTCIYGDQHRSANCGFTLYPPLRRGQDIDEFTEGIKWVVTMDRTELTWLNSDSQESCSDQLRLFEFTAVDSNNTRTYNLVFVLPVGKKRKLCIGTFTCHHSTLDAWRPIVKGMLNTLQ